MMIRRKIEIFKQISVGPLERGDDLSQIRTQSIKVLRNVEILKLSTDLPVIVCGSPRRLKIL